MPSWDQSIQRLRAFRAPARDLTPAPDIARLAKDLARRRAVCGGLDAAWRDILPHDLASITAPERLTPGGVLTVRAQDASARAQFSAWLRSGGVDALRARTPGTLRRIRVV